MMDAVAERVEQRVERERHELERQLAAAEKRCAAAAATLTKMRKPTDALLDKLAAGGTLTAAERKRIERIPRLVGAAHAAQRANVTADAVRQTLARVGTKADLARRIRTAKSLGEPANAGEAVRAVLVKAGKPVHVKDITREMLESGVVRLDGATPEQTVAGWLARQAKDGDEFVRVAPGKYATKDALVRGGDR
jgi:hypothetical protein